MVALKDHFSSLPFVRLAFATSFFFTPFTLSAHDDHDGKAHESAVIQTSVGILVPVDSKADAAWLAKARAAYPNFCPVCDDHIKTEASSDVPEYIYRVAGKPDRLVRFCGEDECVTSFKKDPAKYLKLIDDAAAKK